jgi:hypothetical protein
MVAGPYTTGARTEEEREENLLRLNRAALEVFRKGHVPIVAINLALPILRAAGDDAREPVLMPVALALAARCDAVLRLDGVSVGADEEVECIQSRGGKVFHSLDEIPAVDRR